MLWIAVETSPCENRPPDGNHSALRLQRTRRCIRFKIMIPRQSRGICMCGQSPTNIVIGSPNLPSYNWCRGGFCRYGLLLFVMPLPDRFSMTAKGAFLSYAPFKLPRTPGLARGFPGTKNPAHPWMRGTAGRNCPKKPRETFAVFLFSTPRGCFDTQTGRRPDAVPSFVIQLSPLFLRRNCYRSTWRPQRPDECSRGKRGNPDCSPIPDARWKYPFQNTAPNGSNTAR